MEEDPEVQGLLVVRLAAHGLELVAVGSIAQAKEHLEREEFGAILIDPDLPDGDGFTLLGDAPAERVVILTSHPELARLVDWPAGRLFIKPFDLQELCAKIDEMLRYWPDP